jgi:hypothetical protein
VCLSVVPSIILQQYEIWTTRAVSPSSFLQELDITDEALVENSNFRCDKCAVPAFSTGSIVKLGATGRYIKALIRIKVTSNALERNVATPAELGVKNAWRARWLPWHTYSSLCWDPPGSVNAQSSLLRRAESALISRTILL